MIIHSPVISGSLTFADGATFTLPDGGIYSGSFSGSFQGDGSSLTFGGTNIVSSSEQLSLDFLDTLGDGVVSGSSQILFNDITNNPFTQGASSVTVSKSIVPNSLTLDLGSLSNPFRDLYLSSASLFVDGTQVISSNTNELIITTDTNQSLKLVETGADTVQIQTENGDITLTSTGNGNIELDAPIQIVAGNQILSSDGNAIQFGEDIDVDGDLNVQGNITLTGTVDGVDVLLLSQSVAQQFGELSPDYNDLINIPVGIVSGSAQVKELLPAGTVSGSASEVRAFLNVENGATADQTGAEIKSLYEGEADTNAFTDVEKSKLSGIEAGANVTDAANVDAAGAVMNSDTSTAAMSFVIDEDDMSSDTATKVPTQQSVKKYVDDSIDILIGGAPGALDTLNELAAAINDDSSYASTITTQLATKADKSITISTGNGLSGGGDLSANRTLSMSGTYTGTFAVTGGITATADVIAYASSDRRLKDNIVNIENPIEKVQKLNGVTWDWNDNADELQKSTPTVGVIAQEVEEVLPQLVNTRDNGYKAVDYAKLTGLLIEAIKDQQKQIDELKSRLQ
jgi:hypothetical protein